MLDLLKRPYPIRDVRKPWRRALTVGGFVFLLLLLFRPFGLNDLPFGVVLIDTFNYGLISFLFVYGLAHILPLLFPGFYNEDGWTLGREAISLLTYTMFIAVGNYAYNVLRGHTAFSREGFFFMFLSTIIVASVVVFIIVLIQSNRTLRRNLAAAKAMTNGLHHQPAEVPNLSQEKIRLPAEVESQGIELSPERIICLASDANYIICTYLDDHNDAREHRFRNRMKALDEGLRDYPFLFRCHRAFIVNLRQVQSVDGNAKGYSLQLKAYEPLVPVARSKAKALRERLPSQ